MKEEELKAKEDELRRQKEELRKQINYHDLIDPKQLDEHGVKYKKIKEKK